MNAQLNIGMILDAVDDALKSELTTEHREMYAMQLAYAHANIMTEWTLILEDQLVTQSNPNFPSESYFREKLSGLMSFSRMAIGLEDRGSYSPDKIRENAHHFANTVESLLASLGDSSGT